MITESNLRQVTTVFFGSYWSIENEKPPEWSDHWDFNSSIPNHDKKGCYVLFKNEEVIYIGSAIGKNFGKYKIIKGAYFGGGLGARLKRYWQLNHDTVYNTRYRPSNDWLELTSIMTIGFEEKHYPLAAALEIYLISKLNPPKNLQHKNNNNDENF